VRVRIDPGAVGHSDADALFTPSRTRFFGALALGDIGSHFRSDDVGKTRMFFIEAARLMKKKVFRSSILVGDKFETPKLRPHDQADCAEFGAQALEVKLT